MNTFLWIAVLLLAIIVTWVVAFKAGEWTKARQIRLTAAANRKAKRGHAASSTPLEFVNGAYELPTAVVRVQPVRTSRDDEGCGTPDLEQVPDGYAQELLWNDWVYKIRHSDLSFEQLVNDGLKIGLSKSQAAQYIHEVANRPVFS